MSGHRSVADPHTQIVTGLEQLVMLTRARFGNRDAKRSTNTTYADDSALRECDESRGTRYSERHSAH